VRVPQPPLQHNRVDLELDDLFFAEAELGEQRIGVLTVLRGAVEIQGRLVELHGAGRQGELDAAVLVARGR